MVSQMLQRVGTYYYVFPTYNQGRKILWDGMDKNGFRFIHHFPKEIIENINHSEMKIRTTNGSLFQVIGGDTIDNIVGTNPIGVIFSEYSLQNPRNWAFISPILVENEGWAIFNFTPRGKNHAFKIYETARTTASWFCQKLTVDDTHAMSPAALEQERLQSIQQYGDESFYQQEYFCSFTASVIGAYYASQYAIAEAAGRFTNVPYDPLLPVHTVWDLGISDAMAVGFWQSSGFERRLIDYQEFHGLGLPQIWKKLKEEKEYRYGKHFAPHDIKVRELGTGLSRLEVAAKIGLNFMEIPSIPIIDGIDAGRRLFAKLWVDKTKAADWLELIPQYTKEYDEDNRIFKDKPNHDWTSHGADMFRGAAIVSELMTNDYFGGEGMTRETESAMTLEEKFSGIASNF